MFKEIIRKYYLEEIINLNHSNALWREELVARISNLRSLIKKKFHWKGEVALLPNLYYANKLLEHNKVKAVNFDFFPTKELIAKVDYFTYVPVPGIAILGYNSILESLYIGANSVSALDREGYNLKRDFSSLECGTQNYPLLFILEKYFSTLNE